MGVLLAQNNHGAAAAAAAAAQQCPPPSAEGGRADRQPSFACKRPGCSRTFASLDKLVTHASREHLLAGAAGAAAGRRKRAAAAGAGGETTAPSPLLAALSERAAGMAAAPAAVLLTSAGLALSLWVRHDMQAEIREVAGVAPAQFLDVRPSGYTPEDVGAFLDRLGRKRSLYAALQLEECLLVAPLGAVALSILCTFFLNELSRPPLKFLNLIPFLLPLVKSLETAMLLSLASDHASGAKAPASGKKVSLAALATVAKVRFVLPVVVGFVLSLLLAVAARRALGSGGRWVEMRAREGVEELGESDDEGNPGEDEEGIGLDGGRADKKRTGRNEEKKGKAKTAVAKKTE